jgi:hypothetical protein
MAYGVKRAVAWRAPSRKQRRRKAQRRNVRAAMAETKISESRNGGGNENLLKREKCQRKSASNGM